MRFALACLCACAAALSACSPKGDAAKTDSAPAGGLASPPKPKVGVWESTMQLGGPTPMKVTSQVCIDQAMLVNDGWVKGGQEQQDMPDCQQTVKASATGYVVDSTCKMGDRTVISHGEAKGDFNSAYTMDLSTRIQPAPEGMPPETKMQVAARYIGPCAPGQAGGVVPGSMKMQPAG